MVNKARPKCKCGFGAMEPLYVKGGRGAMGRAGRTFYCPGCDTIAKQSGAVVKTL